MSKTKTKNARGRKEEDARTTTVAPKGVPKPKTKKTITPQNKCSKQQQKKLKYKQLCLALY